MAPRMYETLQFGINQLRADRSDHVDDPFHEGDIIIVSISVAHPSSLKR